MTPRLGNQGLEKKMKAIHRVAIGGTPRNPSLQDQLFVGSNVYGKRGGTSGNPVDAVCVATGTACGHQTIAKLPEETLLRITAAIGPIDGRRAKKLAELGLENELVAEVFIIKLNQENSYAGI